MKYKLGFGTPTDADSTTKELASVLQTEALRELYRKLPTSRMKFVVAAHYDLGYSQELVAEILGIKQPSLQDEIKHIRRVLSGQPYKPHKHKVKIEIKDIMAILAIYARP